VPGNIHLGPFGREGLAPATDGSPGLAASRA
jgi:hypothetical protein